jgi:hypothetical protein
MNNLVQIELSHNRGLLAFFFGIVGEIDFNWLWQWGIYRYRTIACNCIGRKSA